MAEEQILSLKPAPRLEQVGNEHSERVQDRKHRTQLDAMILPHDPNPGRMEFSERTGSRTVVMFELLYQHPCLLK